MAKTIKGPNMTNINGSHTALSAVHKQRIIDENERKPHNRVNPNRSYSNIPIDHLPHRSPSRKTPPKGTYTPIFY